MIVDAHNDLLVEVAHFRHEAHPFRDRWLDQLRRGGVGLQVCPASVDVSELPEFGLRRSLTQITECHRAAADNPDDVLLVRDAARPGERARRRPHRPAAFDGGRRAARV